MRVTASAWLVVFLVGTATAQTPVPKSPITVSPIELVDRLAKSKLAPVEPFTGEERAALEVSWASRNDSKAKPLPQADAAAVAAHLRAGGVTDPEAIAKYLKKFDALVEEAKTATSTHLKHNRSVCVERRDRK